MRSRPSWIPQRKGTLGVLCALPCLPPLCGAPPSCGFDRAQNAKLLYVVIYIKAQRRCLGAQRPSHLSHASREWNDKTETQKHTRHALSLHFRGHTAQASTSRRQTGQVRFLSNQVMMPARPNSCRHGSTTTGLPVGRTSLVIGSSKRRFRMRVGKARFALALSPRFTLFASRLDSMS